MRGKWLLPWLTVLFVVGWASIRAAAAGEDPPPRDPPRERADAPPRDSGDAPPPREWSDAPPPREGDRPREAGRGGPRGPAERFGSSDRPRDGDDRGPGGGFQRGPGRRGPGDLEGAPIGPPEGPRGSEQPFGRRGPGPGAGPGPEGMGPQGPMGPCGPMGPGPRGPWGEPEAMGRGDPEMHRLMLEENELDRRSHELAAQFHRAPSPEKEEIKRELAEVVTKQFRVRQERRMLELKRIEEEVKRLRESIERRNEAQDKIIERRVADLLGLDDLQF